jgi:hypothetical protein
MLRAGILMSHVSFEWQVNVRITHHLCRSSMYLSNHTHAHTTRNTPCVVHNLQDMAGEFKFTFAQTAEDEDATMSVETKTTNNKVASTRSPPYSPASPSYSFASSKHQERQCDDKTPRWMLDAFDARVSVGNHMELQKGGSSRKSLQDVERVERSLPNAFRHVQGAHVMQLWLIHVGGLLGQRIPVYAEYEDNDDLVGRGSLIQGVRALATFLSLAFVDIESPSEGGQQLLVVNPDRVARWGNRVLSDLGRLCKDQSTSADASRGAVAYAGIRDKDAVRMLSDAPRDQPVPLLKVSTTWGACDRTHSVSTESVRLGWRVGRQDAWFESCDIATCRHTAQQIHEYCKRMQQYLDKRCAPLKSEFTIQEVRVKCKSGVLNT